MRGHFERRSWEYDPDLYAPARYRRACAYDSFVPDPLADLSIQLPGDTAGVVSDAEAAISELNRSTERALAPLARLLLRTESIASSKVEGLQVDARSLARAEAKADTGVRPAGTALEVLANIDAMQLAVEEATAAQVVQLDQLVATHRALMVRSPNEAVAGVVRTSQNWIGGNDYNPCGADYVPPPPELVHALMEDLCNFCNDESLPPLVQAAIGHAQFETIHPFVDGNGRTGRALVQVILRRRGLAPAFVPPISVVLAGQKGRYIEGLTWYREGRVTEWVERFSAAATMAAKLATRYVGEVQVLQASWHERLAEAAGPRSDAAAWAIIDVLPAHPVISVPIAVTATGRTRPAVNQGMEQLAVARVLAPITAKQRNRSWEAVGLLDLLPGIESAKI